MSLNCGIAQDLLPLYVEGLCSEESRTALEQHLQECEACRVWYQRMTAEPVEAAPSPPAEEAAHRFRRGMRRVRRRWALSLLAVLVAIPLILMTVAQVRGDGLCFTNLIPVAKCYRFLSLLQDGSYEEAYDLLDTEQIWENLTVYDSERLDKLEDYQAVTIDGAVWMFAPDALLEYFDEVPEVLEGEEALDFWEAVYQHSQTGGNLFLIPAEAYETLEEQGRLNTLADTETWDEEVSYSSSIVVEDSQGNAYYIGSADSLYATSDEEELDSNYYLNYDYDCVPELIWESLKEKLEDEQAEFEAQAEPYLDMGYDAWHTASREHFASSMEQWTEEYGGITQFRFSNAYAGSNEDGSWWQLEFDLWFEGESSSGGGITLFSDGGLTFGGGSTSTQGGKADLFLEAFSAALYVEAVSEALHYEAGEADAAGD
ncbi:MAG: zf-HC2 domain-containing protein [Clostridiales bacterium]|nr:zf-HC2 domain-containing protein [Clostridiales bacterium]